MALSLRQFRLMRTGAILATCLGVGWALTQPPAAQPVEAAAVPQAAAAPAVDERPPREAITGSDPVTLAFAGDTHFENQLRSVAADPAGLAALKPHLSAADVTIVNLETAITSEGTRVPGKQFTFRTPASALTTLAEAGVDVVGLANNHAVDFGSDGLADTLAARADAPVTLMGVGANEAEAFAPVVVTVDGVSVALLNATQLREQTTVQHGAGPDKPGVASAVTPDRLVAAVRDAARRHDVVVAFLHWGVEREFCPSAAQFSLTRALADAGADALIGSHAHRVQGAGWTGSTYVAYGLGNFIWFKDDTFPGRSTGVLTISIDKARVEARRALPPERRTEPGPLVTAEQWVPLENNATGVPAAVDAATAKRMLADRDGRQKCARLTDRP